MPLNASTDLGHALGLRHLHADARAVLAPGRDDRGADARAVAGVHHVFVAGDERRADIVRDDLRGSDAGGSDVGLRHSIIKLDANGGMADVRSAGRVLDDHPSHQCGNPRRLRAVRCDGAAGASRSREPRQSGARNRDRFCDSRRMAVASELDQSRQRVRQRILVVGAGGLWRRRQDVQRGVPVRSDDAAKSARQRDRVPDDPARTRRDARRSRQSALLPLPVRGGGVRDCRVHRGLSRARKVQRATPDVVRARLPRRAHCALLLLRVHRRGLHPSRCVHPVYRGGLRSGGGQSIHAPGIQEPESKDLPARLRGQRDRTRLAAGNLAGFGSRRSSQRAASVLRRWSTRCNRWIRRCPPTRP